MRQPTRPEASPSRAPGLKIERDPPFSKIFSSAFETVPMEAGKTGRGVDLQACVPRAFQKPILRGLLSAPRVYSAWAKRPSPCLTARSSTSRAGGTVHLKILPQGAGRRHYGEEGLPKIEGPSGCSVLQGRVEAKLLSSAVSWAKTARVPR